MDGRTAPDQAERGEAKIDAAAVLDAVVMELLANSRNRGADAVTVAGIRAGYRDVLGAVDGRGTWTWHAWLNARILRRAVVEWLSTARDEGAFMPSPAEFKAVCDFAKGEMEREARPRLPAPAAAPPESARPSNEWLLRRVAAGVVLARRRYAWLAEPELTAPAPTIADVMDDEVDEALVGFAGQRRFERLRALPEDAASVEVVTAASGTLEPWP